MFFCILEIWQIFKYGLKLSINLIFLKSVLLISAPSGCLQYYTSASGAFKSFNYRTEPAADDGPNHLANLNYAICFRIENGFCGIKYSQVSSDLFSFTLTGDASTITALGIIALPKLVTDRVPRTWVLEVPHGEMFC